jgi:hypothetical protein
VYVCDSCVDCPVCTVDVSADVTVYLDEAEKREVHILDTIDVASFFKPGLYKVYINLSGSIEVDSYAPVAIWSALVRRHCDRYKILYQCINRSRYIYPFRYCFGDYYVQRHVTFDHIYEQCNDYELYYVLGYSFVGTYSPSYANEYIRSRIYINAVYKYVEIVQ